MRALPFTSPLSAPATRPVPGWARPAAVFRFGRRPTNSLMLLLAATALFVLAGCSTAHGAVLPERDYLGNAFPKQCRDRAALDAVKVPVIEVARLPYALFGDSMDGLWIERPEGEVIMVRKGLSPKRRAEVLLHEKCHSLMYRLTGNPRWHGAD